MFRIAVIKDVEFGCEQTVNRLRVYCIPCFANRTERLAKTGIRCTSGLNFINKLNETINKFLKMGITAHIRSTAVLGSCSEPKSLL